MITKIKNGKCILKEGITENVYVYLEGIAIKNITDADLPFDREIDASGDYVSPGFIDMHVHGGGGYDFMDGGAEAIVNGAKLHLRHGTTSILPTTLACSRETLLEFLRDLRYVIEENLSECNIIGAHLEGPYFNISQCGAQNPDYIKAPQKEEYKKIISEGKDLIKKWSFAPELSGSEEFCEFLIENSIIPSVGHSDGTYEDFKRVYNTGLRMVTHLYSGMSGLTRRCGYRVPGIVESAYLFNNVTAEVIADGCHLPAELLRLIVKILGSDNICLVTDAMRGAGMGEGKSELGRKGESVPCIIEDGVAKLCDRKGFAGSVATADRLVRNMVKKADVTLWDAVKMMTLNPAKALGLSRKGVLEAGNDADILIFDENINIKRVIVMGKDIRLVNEEIIPNRTC